MGQIEHDEDVIISKKKVKHKSRENLKNQESTRERERVFPKKNSRRNCSILNGLFLKFVLENKSDEKKGFKGFSHQKKRRQRGRETRERLKIKRTKDDCEDGKKRSVFSRLIDIER